MSKQFESLHRLNSHTAKPQVQIPKIPLFAFTPPDSPQINTSSGMKSDTNSDISVFQTKSQFNNSDLETPDEFADSETSLSTCTQSNFSTFSKPLFQPIQPQHQFPSPSTPFPCFPNNPNLLPISFRSIKQKLTKKYTNF